MSTLLECRSWIYLFYSLFQLRPGINEVQTIFGIHFFQGIIVIVDVLDQHSIIDCDSVIEKHSFTRLDFLLATVFFA